MGDKSKAKNNATVAKMECDSYIDYYFYFRRRIVIKVETLFSFYPYSYLK